VISGEEKEERLAKLMDTALSYQADLDFNRARETFREVLKEKPDHRKAHFQLFQINKHEPERPDFHANTDRLLTILARTDSCEDDCLKIYQEYRKVATPQKLSVETCLSLNRIFLKRGLLPEAAAILTMLLKNHSSLPQLPACLLNLGKAYQRQGAFANSAKCLQLLCKRYPDAPEIEAAGAMMRENS
jgi:tetratricopeptide (TPR) repeat protein